MNQQIVEEPKNIIFIQSRAETNHNLVDEYAEMMRAGVQFDAAQGIRDESGQVFVWDGLHRGEAAKMVGALLPVDVRPGTKQDAEWLALTANQKHGLRRSRVDKQRVVRLALKHPHGANLSNSAIARHCGVSDKTVAKIRRELEVSSEIPKIEQRMVSRNGATYGQNTRNIGSSGQPSEVEKKASLQQHQPADVPLKDSRFVMALPGEDNIELVNLALSTSGESGYTPERQPHPCPRCDQDRIVGVNGSKRWCLNCEATWEKAADFLAEVPGSSNSWVSQQARVQQRFLDLLARLDNAQLGQVEAWLDDLEHKLPQPNDTVTAVN